MCLSLVSTTGKEIEIWAAQDHDLCITTHSDLVRRARVSCIPAVTIGAGCSRNDIFQSKCSIVFASREDSMLKTSNGYTHTHTSPDNSDTSMGSIATLICCAGLFIPRTSFVSTEQSQSGVDQILEKQVKRDSKVLAKYPQKFKSSRRISSHWLIFRDHRKLRETELSRV